MSIAHKINGTWQETAGTSPVDDALSSTSTNALQNRVIYDALDNKADTSDLGTAASKNSTSTITSGSTDLPEADAVYNILPVQWPTTWEPKTWNGLTSLNRNYIWTDGDNIYYSDGSNQYVLNKSTSTWTAKTWSGLTNFLGNNIWTDGNNIYYSKVSDQYVLDKSNSTWSTKTWNGLTGLNRSYIWTDGDNIYYSNNSNQYVLDKATSTWTAKTWNGLTSFNGFVTWSDGDNVYYSLGPTQYILDKSTSTWSTKTWNGLTSFIGTSIWTDGDNIYSSNNSNQYVLDKATSTWTAKTWNGLTSFMGDKIWSDGDNIYNSDGSRQYILNKSRGFGSAAARDVTTSVTDGSEDVVTSGAVYDALSNHKSIKYVHVFGGYDRFDRNNVLKIVSNRDANLYFYCGGILLLIDDWLYFNGCVGYTHISSLTRPMELSTCSISSADSTLSNLQWDPDWVDSLSAYDSELLGCGYLICGGPMDTFTPIKGTLNLTTKTLADTYTEGITKVYFCGKVIPKT